MNDQRGAIAVTPQIPAWDFPRPSALLPIHCFQATVEAPF